MDLVGMEVRKSFLGFGVFSGVVESYDPTTGYFQIHYEDGDSEEVDFEEITSILKAMGESLPAEPERRTNRGRPPKKRRQFEPGPAEAGGTVGGLEDDVATGEVAETLIKGSEVLKENGGFRVLEEIQVNGDCLNGDLEGNALLDDPNESEAEVGSFENQGAESTAFSPVQKSEEVRRKRGRPCKEKPTPDTPLRRSVRRKSAPIEDVVLDEDTELGGQQCFVVPVESTKPMLPPNSNDLDIEGLNVFDLFSVYTCLRSFSRFLFLSPFRMETFVAALRFKYANFLIDSIHFSILNALKLHLETLGEDGSQSAACCLRNLNWDLLDLVTWPVFLAEYLLLHGSEMKPCFKLSQLKLLDVEYYKQPAEVKLEVLRCLCDDVIEVEALRSELNRRILDCGFNLDVTYNVNVERKRKASAINHPGSSLAQEAVEDTDDGNSDECCLCGMDGNLICCDGCPAAFHSRCVGVAKDSLPDGDWYCPECLLGKGDESIKLSEPFRGAELLGIDPHGRLYFGSCGRLLVSDSWDSDASYHYYNRKDLDAVISVLKSSHVSYSAIINSISAHWGIPVYPSSSNGQCLNDIHQIHEDFGQKCSELVVPLNQDTLSNGYVERITTENFASPERCGYKNSEVSNLVQLNSVSSHFEGLICPSACSEAFDEAVHAATSVQMSQQTCPNSSMCAIALSKEVISSDSAELALGSEKSIGFQGWGCTSLVDRRKGGVSQVQSDPGSYVNYYSFGRIASSISLELMHKSSEINDKSKNSFEDTKSAQVKAISKRSIKCCWYTYQRLSTDAQKENCGWCVSCKTSSDSDCLFKVANHTNLEGSKDKNIDVSKNRTVGLRSEKNKKSHITSAMHYLLSIEDRVCGLLCGPWEKPHYSQHWRKAVLKASDVASLRSLLLTLELNMRRVALSLEWSKPVDYPHVVGSASIVFTSPIHASSNNGGSRKQAKKIISGDEFSSSSHKSTASGIYLWRGGRLSRQVFHWKMLPRSLATKGARQAGCRKIPNILYPDGSEFAKRSKYVAWRAAVEMSHSVAQLAYQVKDFDSNIKWKELLDTRLFPQKTKESKKIARPLKVTIRKKSIEGTLVKYLLDFGKREPIPAIVTKHGLLLEESSKGRKSYWLTETHVPLNLLKSYEEKKIARLSKKMDSGMQTVKESQCKVEKKISKGLSYLISREQKFEKQLCGHCNKDVLIREAVTCQFCDGFFHRKHFRVPKGAVTATYTCCRCKDKSSEKLKSKDKSSEKLKSKDKSGEKLKIQGKKVVSKRRKNTEVKKSQETHEKRKHILTKSKKFKGHKKDNQSQSRKGKSEKSDNGLKWRKRKRSVVPHSYWLNGLRWTRRPVAEQGREFREAKVILPFQHTEAPYVNPSCCLCHKEFNPGVIYIGCENCEGWFHGDVFCLTHENIKHLIGFKCHKCRKRSEPVCPFSEVPLVSEDQLEKCNIGVDILGAEHQNNEDKLLGALGEDCSAEANSEDHLDGKQSKNILPEKEFLCPERLSEKEDIAGEYEDCSAAIRREDHVDGEPKGSFLRHSEVEPVLYPKTISRNGVITQLLEHLEANVTSTKDENEI